MHPYLLDMLNQQHRDDLRRTASPRRARRPLTRPLPTLPCVPVAGWRRTAARLLHTHPTATRFAR